MTNGGTFTWMQLGLQAVDARNGAILAERFQGTPLLSMMVAPDGTVYVVTGQPGTGNVGCPCAVQRLQPQTLATMARRGLGGDVDTVAPALYLLRAL